MDKEELQAVKERLSNQRWTDAEHIDLYDRRDRIPFDRLADFFTVNMQ